ncbi:hypothetical protein [Tunturiibacter gelidoferens]|uniref:Uncharacterized protein n=3 Tax=Tunturiibacter TaxID=3154218 RepID=A0A7Y9T4P0_9BACT|nr:hypothetical protein [Edaphobacter lichenicola]MBB5341309.1 hypothetical protein [Edaphobacter lichenicola]NYF53682.1 hypothetical protein [Edaphobacter lichenicola]
MTLLSGWWWMGCVVVDGLCRCGELGAEKALGRNFVRPLGVQGHGGAAGFLRDGDGGGDVALIVL